MQLVFRLECIGQFHLWCGSAWGILSAIHPMCALIMLLCAGISSLRGEESSSRSRQRLRATIDATHPDDRPAMLFELTFDARPDIRVMALDYLHDVAPDARLRNRVKQIIETERDPIVLGYARLLGTAWNTNADAIESELVRLPPTNLFSHREFQRDSNAAPPGFEVTFESQESGDSLSMSNRTPGSLMPAAPYWATKAGQTYEGFPSDVNRFDPTGRPIFSRASFVDPDIEPNILRRLIDVPPDDFEGPQIGFDEPTIYEQEAPLGYAGPSGVLPTEVPEYSHFIPVEDRWRLGFPAWDRYQRGHPFDDDYPYMEGNILDPYNQNVLKGDYPIVGQHTFLNLTVISQTLGELRNVPTATTPFESTRTPFSENFFGGPTQFQFAKNVRLIVEVFHGNEAFKPMDWKIRVEPVFSVSHLSVDELAVVNPNVLAGTHRTRQDFALEEYFLEMKLADLGPDYDFVSARVGSQLFASDFRGFLFRDINRAVRLFGTRLSNRDQFNIVWFDMLEKDTNSELNTFDDRHQNVFIANYFRQDFIFPGYTAQLSFHYNLDKPSFEFDQNDVLVRPDPAGVFQQHQVDAYYIGVAGDGHIGRINITNQVYMALGRDSFNPIGGCSQDIQAMMAAIELSYDRDWIRFRSSYFFASGDDDPTNRDAGGFDTIIDDPIFAGGEFSYWQRQAVRLFGVNLTQRKSLVPNLRSSKIQGQSNFVNPGLHLFNFGMDFEIDPKVKLITNANYLFFDNTAVLEHFVFQGNIGREIGTDLSAGLEYRPFLNDNVIIVIGSAVLIPADGLNDLFGAEVPAAIMAINGWTTEKQKLNAHFAEVFLTY